MKIKSSLKRKYPQANNINQTNYAMRYLLLLFIILCSCKREQKVESEIIEPTSDTVSIPVETLPTKHFSNARFQEVSVEKTAENTFHISGKAQIFEASFSWVVEDGHNELAQGHEMTDAGAPEWGKFSFDVTVDKEQENSTLTLILYEASAKDGSRQHQLPIPLP